MDQEVSFRKVSIRPIALLKEALSLLGDQYWLFVGITLVGILIGSVVPLGILMGPMMCGIYLCYLRKSQNQRVTFDLLFKGFDYFLESLIATLIIVAVMMVVILPAYLITFVAFVGLMAGHEGEPSPAPFLVIIPMYLVIVLLIILISLPFIFTFPLIVDRGLKAIPALKASIQAVLANLVGLVGMMLLYLLISSIGTCMCYVPAILFMPLSFGGMFLAYRQIFPTE